MTKELVNKEETGLVTFDTGENWGAGETIDKEDIKLPRLMLMQGLSDLVDQGKAKVGEFVNSLDEVALGSEIDFITFGSFKQLLTYKNDEFESIEDYKPEHKQLPYEETIDGALIKRTTSLNFYVLTLEDIKSGVPFPMVLSFKSMSYKAGKDLTTIIAKLNALGAPSAAKVISLRSIKTENDKGKFHIMSVTAGRNSTKEEVLLAKQWYESLKVAKEQGTLNVDTDEATKPKPKDATPSDIKGNDEIPF